MNTQMLRDITDAYGSMESPHWAFVCKRYDTNPYQSLESQIREFSDSKKELEYNHDTMIFYYITSKYGDLALFVSLVGKYAYIGDNDGKVLTESELLSDELGQKLLPVLHREGIMIMTVDQMKEGIYFNNEQTLLYRVLFSESAPPWEWYEAGGPGWLDLEPTGVTWHRRFAGTRLTVSDPLPDAPPR